MTDLAATIAPKSDQLNADDLIAGPRTIKITRVSASGDGDQPIAVNFEGDNGKPWKPCKSMRRVLVHVWGRDGNSYVGRSLTLYRDPAVRFGGIEVGGIRISHMSDIDRDVTMALTATRANRKPFTVKPLVVRERAAPKDGGEAPSTESSRDKHYAYTNAKWTEIQNADDLGTLDQIEAGSANARAKMRTQGSADLADQIERQIAERRAELAGGAA